MNARNIRLPLAWLVLSAITLIYLWVDAGDSDGTIRPSIAITTVAIVMATIKVRIIFQEFMEVRTAPVLLRRLADLWVLIIAAALLGSYFTGLATR